MNGNAISIYNAPLVNAVINYIIKNKQTVEKLYANRLGFYMGAMETIVPILKEQMGEINWEKSKERAYINKLHAFINDQTVHFEINSIDNIELKSIAAFILKGQSYNDCVALCKMTEFENYRYVLSLWGSLCGYMEMNRDALSDILNMSTYSLVYEKIYGKNMGILSHNIANSESFINCCSEEIEKRSYKFSKEELSFILKSVNFKEVTQLVNKLESLLSVSSKPINECFEDAINETLSKKAKKQKELAWLSLKIYQSVDNYDVICTILKETNLSKTVQKNILKHFGYNEEKKCKIKIKKQDNLSLFPEMNKATSITQSVSNRLPNIPSFVGLDKNVLRRLEQNWSFTALKYPNNKEEHIRFFINLCKKEGFSGNVKGPTSLTYVFTQEMASKVEKELLIYYDIR